MTFAEVHRSHRFDDMTVRQPFDVWQYIDEEQVAGTELNQKLFCQPTLEVAETKHTKFGSLSNLPCDSVHPASGSR
ncbi:hypothetical protein IAQ61_011817 [Plenodomus lingam]|uniref:uncharacterized protein n=1 Tax=Leptosphaeria maculans TaxID=5022 RepID=UPI003329BB7F|nr:hypothetical protein IAQ61_011817 [Plenodomus lingam]